jgi:hypothetical protein
VATSLADYTQSPIPGGGVALYHDDVMHLPGEFDRLSDGK